jgi:hypothetical protein
LCVATKRIRAGLDIADARDGPIIASFHRASDAFCKPTGRIFGAIVAEDCIAARRQFESETASDLIHRDREHLVLLDLDAADGEGESGRLHDEVEDARKRRERQLE